MESFVCRSVRLDQIPLEASSTYPVIVRDPNVVVVLLDLSGYTKATRHLIESAGEQLNANQYVGNLVQHFLNPLFDLVSSYGGDVVRYGGDSLICLWRNAEVDRRGWFQAIKCCIEAIRAVRKRPLLDMEQQVIPIAVHAAVHFGAVDLIYVGDKGSRADIIPNGFVYEKACELLDKANKDEIALSMTVWHLLQTSTRDFDFLRPYIASHTIHPFNVIFRVDTNKAGNFNSTVNELAKTTFNLTWRHWKDFVDATVRSHQGIMLPEMRQATVVFLNLKPQQPETLAYSLNEIIRAAEQELTGVGVLRQLSKDEKGITLLMIFGFPPSQSENPCLSAACVALKLLDIIRIQSMPFVASCGLATGRVFSGVIGTSDGQRQEHAILGSAVNLAARLMMNEQALLSVLCDQTSRDLLLQYARLVRTVPTQQPLSLKGWNDPITVFTIATHDAKALQRLDTQSVIPDPQALIQIDFHDASQDKEWHHYFDRWIQQTESNASPFACVIEGPSGAGKSYTAARIRQYVLQKKTIEVWQIQTFEIEQSTPFSCVRQILDLVVLYYNNYSKQKRNIRDICLALGLNRKQIDTLSYELQAAVTSVVAANSVPGTAETERPSITAEELLQEVVDAIVAVLNALTNATGTRFVMMFDDCQWQDHYSWATTAAIHACCHKAFLVLISRPVREYRDPHLAALFTKISTSPSNMGIAVGNLSRDRIQMIVTYLFAKFLAKETILSLSDRLLEMSGGNAFALDVLLNHVRQKGDLSVLSDPLNVLPKDIKSVFVLQFDSLEKPFQQLIRMASLISQMFYLKDVIELCKFDEAEGKEILSKIPTWDKYGMIEPLGGGRWRFKHCLINYQIYSLMTTEDRKRRQRLVAQYFEAVITLADGKKRKSELLPILLKLYQDNEDADSIFRISCKLVTLYKKLEMRHSCREMILAVVSDKERFKLLPKLKQDKINVIGLQLGSLFLDNQMMHQFIGPAVEGLFNFKLKNCLLALVFQYLHSKKTLNENWRRICKTGVISVIAQPARSIEESGHYNFLLQAIMDMCSSPTDIKLTLSSLIVFNSMTREILQWSPDPENFGSYAAFGCSSLFFQNCHETAHEVYKMTGMATLAEDSLVMKQVRKFESMTRYELECDSGAFKCLVRGTGYVYFMFRVHLKNAMILGRRLQNLALKLQSIDMMYLLNIYFNSCWAFGDATFNSNDDPVAIYVNLVRELVESRPSYTPEAELTACAMANFLVNSTEIYMNILRPDLYELTKTENGPDLDLRSLEFALQYCRNLCPMEQVKLLKHNQFSLYTLGLMFYEMSHGNFNESILYLEAIVDLCKRSKLLFKVIYYANLAAYFSRFFLNIMYLCDYPDVGIAKPSQSDKIRLLKLFTEYISAVVSITKNPEKYKSFQFAEVAYCDAICFKLYLSCKTQQAKLLLLDKINRSILRLEQFDEFNTREQLYMLRSLVYLNKMPFWPSELGLMREAERNACLESFNKALDFQEKSNRFRTQRHLERLMIDHKFSTKSKVIKKTKL